MANSVFDSMIEALKAELDEATAYKVLDCLVKTCGGERVYIPVKNTAPQPVLPTDTPKSLQKRLGCSRRTAYNKLSRHRI